MRRNTTINLTNQLTETQRELSSSTQTLNNLQRQLQAVENSTQQAENQLNSALSTQACITSQLEIQNQTFNALTYLFDQYRESQGITLNPSIIFTRTISAEELAHTDTLKEACKANYKQGFDIALDRLTDLNFQDNEGKTILMHAIINGFYYGVDKLLQKGANVNLIDKQGVNALIYSAQLSHIKYTKQIAIKTNDINLKVKEFGDSNTLHILVMNTRNTMFASELNGELKNAGRRFDNLKVLVADEEINDASLGWSVGTLQVNSHVTITGTETIMTGKPVNHEKAIQLIVALTTLGADVNAQNGQGLTTFFLACVLRLENLAHDLLDQCEINLSLIDNFGFNALHWGIEVRDIKLIDKIIIKGANINHQDNEGCTALFWATKYLVVDIIILLLDKFMHKIYLISVDIQLGILLPRIYNRI